MSETCAECGDSPAPRRLNPPFDWTEYLREERDFGPPIGSVWIPLCGDCYHKAEHTRLSYISQATGEAGEVIEADSEDFLDSLDLDALIDDAMP
ncbi:hypothetical protein NDI85_16300 [Halomicroarcula sp. S1AR25-4]|uniref:hypothetical protein n=1 Tax=Haloarcula sp. S1AR25-4 TaxID=2950538 RepID=UPI0028745DED|nr:hypothetical protein [Halomicroarcula sp. S1AR25-4]MDS0279363.1 hypothetical protein [Halomicroarcula sp. S1AR25-4]